MADLVQLDRGQVTELRKYGSDEAQHFDVRLFILPALSLLSLTVAVLIAAYALLRRVFAPLNLGSPTILESVVWPPGLTTFRFLIILFFLLAIGLFLAARWQIKNNRSMKAAAGCPSCHEKELMRVSRTKRDRLITISGIRVARYQCRECHWNGRRVYGGNHFPQEDISMQDTVNLFSGTQSGFSVSSQGDANAAQIPAETAVIDALPETSPAAVSEVADAPPHSQTLQPEQVDGDHEADQAHLLNSGDKAKIMATFGVNLRSQPRLDAMWVGLLGPEAAVLINSSQRKDDGTVWYHIRAGKQSGWVTEDSIEKPITNHR